MTDATSRLRSFLVQTLRTKSSLEGLDEPMIRGLSSPAEVQPVALQGRLLVQPFARELAAVIDADLRRQHGTLASDAVEHLRDASACGPMTSIATRCSEEACHRAFYGFSPPINRSAYR